MKRYFLNIIRAVFNMETEPEYYEQKKMIIEERKYMVGHLRAMLHNLPYHLNLDINEEYYLAEIFEGLNRLFDDRGNLEISSEKWEYLENKYIGTYAGHAKCDLVTREDFDNARNYKKIHQIGDPVALLKIAKTILFNNVDKYQKKEIWYKDMPKNID